MSLVKRQAGKCACGCGRAIWPAPPFKYHVDHIVPLAKGGSNHPANLQLLTPRCNLIKSDKL